MCGIAAYIGNDNASKVLLEKLKIMEYRGYDSAGIACLVDEEIKTYKKVGRVERLEGVVKDVYSNFGIGHTRWATHGEVSEVNAHPHLSYDGQWAVVHNGIIENYKEIKQKYLNGVKIVSQTDTEIVAHLLAKFYNGDAITALKDVCSVLKGSFALACIHSKDKKIYLAKYGSPLCVGSVVDGMIAVSDVLSFCNREGDFCCLEDGEFAVLDKKSAVFFDKDLKVVDKKMQCVICKEDYYLLQNQKNRMIFEIKEIPSVIEKISSLYQEEYVLQRIKKLGDKNIKAVRFVGCGTSYHACLYGAKLVRETLNLEATAHIASELDVPTGRSGDVFVFLSQSGETADVLKCFNSIKNKKNCIVVTNVLNSTLARSCNIVFDLVSGAEIAVASTKTFVAQIAVIYAVVSFIAKKDYKKSLIDLRWVLNSEVDFFSLSQILLRRKNVFILGRGYDYVTAKEASLKFKEVPYVNATAYTSGELKHGPLALIDEDSVVIAIATDKEEATRTVNAVNEAVSRGAKAVLITTVLCKEVIKDAEAKVIYVEDLGKFLNVITAILPLQYCSYYIALKKGIDPDRPRNLAKSVTVE